MPTSASEQNTRLRARQLQRLNEKNEREALPEDLQFANLLEPNWKVVPEGEVDVPEEWAKRSGSLISTLTHFRKSVKLLVENQGLPLHEGPEPLEQALPELVQTREGDREGDKSYDEPLIEFSEPPKPTPRQGKAKTDTSSGAKTFQDVLEAPKERPRYLEAEDANNEHQRRLQVEKRLADTTEQLRHLDIQWSEEKRVLKDKLRQVSKDLDKATTERDQATDRLNQATAQLSRTKDQLSQTTILLEEAKKQLDNMITELYQVKEAKEKGGKRRQQEQIYPFLTDENYETLRMMMNKSKARQG
ncbi:hypothetical protein LCI18_013797 [Fusarium solani-melongenae]|uniref:Uncharacterized protein n=1 Tax=Fusarium solani subsp. cucurbitae TaxID=2747967 RepID=A0ACD3ZP28_FUSSC|nr:hypothetical protein LCI18_013797 [Fusarium solani-melongenae]